MPFGRLVNEADTRLRSWLESISSKPGTRLPSERALARQLGLQHYALNRAMARLITEGKVERDGYKLFVSGGAQPLPVLSCHLVVAQRSIHLPGYRRVAKEMGVKLILHTWESTEEAVRALDQLDTHETEAVIFDPPYSSPLGLWEPVAHRLVKHGIPLVCLGQPVPALFSVLADNIASLQIAVLHLLELGHHEIGLVTAPPANPASSEVLTAWGDLCRKHKLGRSTARIHVQTQIRLKTEADEVVRLVSTDWSAITALVVFSGLDYNIQLLQEQLAHAGRPVPRNLSLLFIGGSKPAATATPPVTTVGVDMAVMQETAFNLAFRAARKKKAMGLLPPPCALRLQPQFFLRNSTTPPASAVPGKTRAAAAGLAAEAPPKPPVETARSLESCLRKAYPLAARASLAEHPPFAPVDLVPHVNRPLNFRRGWLGDLPLKHFPPGSHEIHGVPFQILGGSRRTDCGAIVFHSAVNTTGNSQRLPDKVVIPIGSKARAVYILHGCGYAKFLHPFAHYDFHGPRSRIERVPLVALGQPPPDYNPSQHDARTPTPNIQDWWPDFPHMDFPHARMAPVMETDEAGHLPRHVYLYTFEWINPSPEKVVSRLEITVDSTLATTLGVLAMTVLTC